jgi:hypothetical protein
MTRWAESPDAAREHDEPLLPTVGTRDAGKPAAGVAAVKILLDHLLDDRTEKIVLPLETTLMLRNEPLEMIEKYPVTVRDGVARPFRESGCERLRFPRERCSVHFPE